MLIWGLILSGSLFAQYVELEKEVFLPHQSTYFWNTHFSPNGEYLLMNQSYLGALLLDTSLNLLREHRTTCGACGGGNGRISQDNRTWFSVIRDFSDTEDSVRMLDLETGDSSYMVLEQFSNYKMMNTSNKVLSSYDGEFVMYDMDEDSYEKINVKHNIKSDSHIDAWCYFSPNDEIMVMHTKQSGLEAYTTKNWKLKKALVRSVDSRDMTGVSHDGKTFYGIDNNHVFLFDFEYQQMFDDFVLGDTILWSFHLSKDRSFAVYRDRRCDVYYYDLKSKKSTLLLKANNYLRYDGICLSDDERYMIMGVNGHRVVKLALHHEGEGDVDREMPEIFSYTEEQAAKMMEEELQIELAFRKMGYNIPLDNDINQADSRIMRKWCDENGYRSIWSDEAQEALGIPAEAQR